VHERASAAAAALGRVCEASARDVLTAVLHRIAPRLAAVTAAGTVSSTADGGKPASCSRLLLQAPSELRFSVPAGAANTSGAGLLPEVQATLDRVAGEWGLKVALRGEAYVGS